MKVRVRSERLPWRRYLDFALVSVEGGIYRYMYRYEGGGLIYSERSRM